MHSTTPDDVPESAIVAAPLNSHLRHNYWCAFRGFASWNLLLS